jgi:hypothetical protein
MRTLSSLRAWLAQRKKFWLLPMVSVVLLFLILAVLSRRSPEAFVYTLF